MSRLQSGVRAAVGDVPLARRRCAFQGVKGMATRVEDLVKQLSEGRINRRQFVAGGLRLGLALSSIEFLLAACQSGPPTSSKKDQLVIAIPTTPGGLDPEFHTGLTVAPVLMGGVLALTSWAKIDSPANPGGYDVYWNAPDYKTATAPSLATSWDVSPDGRVYTFHLRTGVKSPYGNEMTANDVRWHWERAFGDKAIGSFLDSVQQIGSLDDVKVIDNQTIQFTLQKATPDFLLTMNDTFRTFIYDSTEVKKHATASDPWANDWIKNHIASFGPYKMDSFEAGNQITMSANPGSFIKPKIQRLLFKVIPDSAQRLSLITKGEVDVALGFAPKELLTLRSTNGVKVWSFPGELMIGATLVTDFPPLNNTKARQALAWAVPYDAIVNDVFAGTAQRSYGPLVSNAPGFDKSIFPYSTDYNKAKQLLTEAGVGSGFKTTFTYDQSDPVGELIGVQLKSSFAKIGVDLSLVGLPSGQANDSLNNGKSPLGYFNLGLDIPDPQFILSALFVTKSAINWSHYSNPEVDRRVAAAAGIQDWPQRLAADNAATKIVVDDAAWLWMAQPGEHFITTNKVTGMNWYGGQGMRWDLVDFT